MNITKNDHAEILSSYEILSQRNQQNIRPYTSVLKVQKLRCA